MPVTLCAARLSVTISPGRRSGAASARTKPGRLRRPWDRRAALARKCPSESGRRRRSRSSSVRAAAIDVSVRYRPQLDLVMLTTNVSDYNICSSSSRRDEHCSTAVSEFAFQLCSLMCASPAFVPAASCFFPVLTGLTGGTAARAPAETAGSRAPTAAAGAPRAVTVGGPPSNPFDTRFPSGGTRRSHARSRLRRKKETHAPWRRHRFSSIPH